MRRWDPKPFYPEISPPGRQLGPCDVGPERTNPRGGKDWPFLIMPAQPERARLEGENGGGIIQIIKVGLVNYQKRKHWRM